MKLHNVVMTLHPTQEASFFSDLRIIDKQECEHQQEFANAYLQTTYLSYEIFNY